MNPFLSVFITILGIAAVSSAATPQSCRFKAAEIVAQDLNQNGRLWEPRQYKSGEVVILVKGGKVWLDLADEELYLCEDWNETVCVDYKFQDPETRRVEHLVQLEVDKKGCIARGYQNLVGSRPWR